MTGSYLSRWPRLTRVRIALILTGAALCVAVPLQVASWVRQIALDELRTRSGHTLNLVVENLRGELAKFRHQPKLLATTREFAAVLRSDASPALIQSINEELARINTVSGALDTYLMNTDGLTIAASNWASERPFVGQNFSYRPYFQAAMQGRLGRYFALGTTSGERGYYFAYPVREHGTIMGVLVVKVEVGQLERAWQAPDGEVMVVDPHGVIFLSSNPHLRLRTLAPLAPEIVTVLKQSRKYSARTLEPLNVVRTRAAGDTMEFMTVESPNPATRTDDSKSTEYLAQHIEMASAGWRVIMLADTRNIAWQANVSIIVAALAMVSLTLIAAILHQRRGRIAERIAMQDAAQIKLEQSVQQRTSELTAANVRLKSEIEVRLRAEEELRRTQSDLVQATKLAALGQMSAGLSHELNQPLAAIETYADNARALIERGDHVTASQNLLGISDLIKRMARIIKNLRTYARNEPVMTRPASLRRAIDGALTLLHQRIERDGVAVHFNSADFELNVLGGDIRLQQVFVNLISNALDAMSGCSPREIRIGIMRMPGKVCVTLHDSGPGIAAEHLKNVFDPFYSTKQVGEGMGLGLSIAFGIMKQFGGAIEAANHERGGALFTMTLLDVAEETGEAA
jgi:two-component system C4-dicarboxylate transport sensor histidine kinase DctB